MCSVQSPLGDPQQPHGCSRNVPSAASAGCLPCALFLVFAFASSTEKASLERAAGFSRLAQDEAILLRALSQKRVLKFKPRGAGLPSSPLGEEPLSPFLTVFSQSVSWQARTTMIFPPFFFFSPFFSLPLFLSAHPAPFGQPRSLSQLCEELWKLGLGAAGRAGEAPSSEGSGTQPVAAPWGDEESPHICRALGEAARFMGSRRLGPSPLAQQLQEKKLGRPEPAGS